jgi:hypothetical protein
MKTATKAPKIYSSSKIVICPSKAEAKEYMKKYVEITGTDNIYEDRDLFDSLYRAACTEHVYNDKTISELEIISEDYRMKFPTQNINIHSEDHGGLWYGFTTWEKQIECFFEYPVFTEAGKAVMKKRQEEAAKLGIIASWD